MKHYSLIVVIAILLVAFSAGCPSEPSETTTTDGEPATTASANPGGQTAHTNPGEKNVTANGASPAGGAPADPAVSDAGSVVDSLFKQRSAVEHEIEYLRAKPGADPTLLAAAEQELAAIDDQLLALASTDRAGLLKQLEQLAGVDPKIAGEWTALVEGTPDNTGTTTPPAGAIALRGEPYTGTATPIEELRKELAEVWEVEFTTTFGKFTVEVYPELAPVHGIRFLELVDAGFYNKMHIHRIAPEWVVQWGDLYDRSNLTGLRPGEEPPVFPRYADRKDLVVNLQDEAVRFPNEKWTISFAKAGPNTASSQPFINLKDNLQLDTYSPPFSPFAYVTEGRDNIDRLVAAFGPAMESAKADLRTELAAKGAPPEIIEQEVRNDLQWGQFVGKYWDPFTVALITEAKIIKRPV